MRKFLIVAVWAALFANSPAQAESIRVNGIELRYDVHGSGDPLILLHGFGVCGAMWTPIVPALAERYRVIVVDMRGHGGSTNPSGKFSHAQSAQDIRALMDSLHIEQARAIGFSSGAMTLLQLATKYPDRLTKMVLVSGTTKFGDQARKILRSSSMETMPPQVLEMFRNCATRGEAQVRELVAQFRAFGDSTDDMNLTTTDLAKIKASTLIVNGDRDEFFPVSIPVAMYGAIPKAALWIVPGGDHSPTAGADQKAFSDAVNEFLAKP